MSRSPNADRAAAIAAAIARFQAEMTPNESGPRQTVDAWQRAALVEGVGTKGIVQKQLEGGSKWLS